MDTNHTLKRCPQQLVSRSAGSGQHAAADALAIPGLSDAIVAVLTAAIACESLIGEGCDPALCRLRHASESYRRRSAAIGAAPQPHERGAPHGS